MTSRKTAAGCVAVAAGVGGLAWMELAVTYHVINVAVAGLFAFLVALAVGLVSVPHLMAARTVGRLSSAPVRARSTTGDGPS